MCALHFGILWLTLVDGRLLRTAWFGRHIIFVQFLAGVALIFHLCALSPQFLIGATHLFLSFFSKLVCLFFSSFFFGEALDYPVIRLGFSLPAPLVRVIAHLLLPFPVFTVTFHLFISSLYDF